jgi:hypothetical protein
LQRGEGRSAADDFSDHMRAGYWQTPRGFAALLMAGLTANQRDDENDQQNQAECSSTDPIYVSEHWCD